LKFEAINVEDVIAEVEGAKHLRLVILDACRDIPLPAFFVSSRAEIHG
jgi:hypothetical protein